MFNTVSRNKRTTYNKELVWIFNVLFILHYTSIVSSSSQNEPPQIIKEVPNSNAHIVQELDTGMDYSDGSIFEILDESVKFSDDNALHEGKDSSEIFLQLDENRDSFARDIGDSEEDPVRSANLGKSYIYTLAGNCYDMLCRVSHLSCVARKPVFGVFDQVRHNPACTGTEDV